MAAEFSIPALSDEELRAQVAALSNHLDQVVYCNRRCAKTPLDPTNLSLHILCTRNPTEEVIDEAGTKIKCKKEWYYLVLSETIIATKNKSRDVQILVEGGLSMIKSEVLLRSGEMVQKKLED
jgi:hypothetical protein